MTKGNDYMSLLNRSAEENGVTWSVTHDGGKEFTVAVGEQSRSYTCNYAPVFGLDISDIEGINALLDELFAEVHNLVH